MNSKNAEPLAKELVELLTERGESIALAESCTGGLAASYLCSIPGASKVFWGSFVSYSIEAKSIMLGIPVRSIEKHDPVSREIALAMAEEAVKKSGVNWAFSITGLAGPALKDEAVGTVWIGTACKIKDTLVSNAEVFMFADKDKVLERNEIRKAACAAAFRKIINQINGHLSAY